MNSKQNKTVKAIAKTIKSVSLKVAQKASKTGKVIAKTVACKTVAKTAKISNRNTIAVIQLTPKGRRIRKYNSMSDAERATGVNTGSISKVVRGIIKTAGGFVWANA